MIAKILVSNASFSGVTYNTGKVDKNRGELMLTANFGPLQAMGNLRPQDYINYLKLVSAQNKNISKPQFHAVLSAKGKSYNKEALTEIAVRWLKEMGYGSQPYLIVYHKDTANNHVHMVSTRVTREGVKIDSAFEHRRAVENIRKVLGYDFAFSYKFSTRAQFMMVLESKGYLGTDPDERKIQERIVNFRLDKKRAGALRELLLQYKDRPGFVTDLKGKQDIELVFHSAEGKKPYGYTIIDHAEKKVFKGSEVLSLRELFNNQATISSYDFRINSEQETVNPAPLYIQPIRISDDVDDQQVHGMRRRRQKTARGNRR